MYTYDVRKQIRTENKKRLFGDISIVIILISMITIIMLLCDLKNPFIILTPSTDRVIEENFINGANYVRFDNSDLEFTGYYKMDQRGNVIYNCYAITIDQMKYFVFVPENRSGSDSENPDSDLTGYSFTAKLEEDDELFQMVASDYDLEADEFREQYGVSNIIFNEAKSGYKETLALWVLFISTIILSVVYVVISLLKVNKLTRSKAVRELSKYGELESVLDDINKEVNTKILYESNIIKITTNWLLVFDTGTIILLPFQDMKSIEKKKKLKMVYGHFPIGLYSCLEIVLKDDSLWRIPIDNSDNKEEIYGICHEKVDIFINK